MALSVAYYVTYTPNIYRYWFVYRLPYMLWFTDPRTAVYSYRPCVIDRSLIIALHSCTYYTISHHVLALNLVL